MDNFFARFQPEYAARGIPTFPVADKKPIVRRYNRIGLPASAELARKHPDASGFGCMMGPRTGLTIVDVDARGKEGERLLTTLQDKYGQAKVIVRTGSDGFHAYYRHNGESRKTKAEPNVDILGGGFAVLPPSQGKVHPYEIIHGTIDDLAVLTPMRRFTAPSIVVPDGGIADAVSVDSRPITEGRRNDTLWQHCMHSAHHCDDFETLLDVARTRNDEFRPPLGDEEVVKIAKSAWGYTERGENRFGQTGAWLPTAEINSLIDANPDALLLLTVLRGNNGPRSKFMVANGMKDTFGWSRQRMAKARRWLENHGYLVEVEAPDSWSGPALYRWASARNDISASSAKGFRERYRLQFCSQEPDDDWLRERKIDKWQ